MLTQRPLIPLDQAVPELLLQRHPGLFQQDAAEFQNFSEFLKIAFPFGMRKVLEVGSCSGVSTYLLAKRVGIQQLDVVDNESFPACRLRPVFHAMIQGRDLLGDSHGPEATRFAEIAPEEYDLVFIDGDHSYAGVKQDAVVFAHLARPGGFIAFHDIQGEAGVQRFWKEHFDPSARHPMLADYRPVHVFLSSGTSCGIGVLERSKK